MINRPVFIKFCPKCGSRMSHSEVTVSSNRSSTSRPPFYVIDKIRLECTNKNCNHVIAIKVEDI